MTHLRGTVSQRWSGAPTFSTVFLAALGAARMPRHPPSLPWGPAPETSHQWGLPWPAFTYHTPSNSNPFPLFSFIHSSLQHLTNICLLIICLLQPECNKFHKGKSLYLAPRTVPGIQQALGDSTVKKEPSCTVGGNANGYSTYGEQCECSSKN